MLEGNAGQVLNQLIASAIAIGMGVVGTFIILKIVDLAIGVRVTTEDEILGLDLTQHGEEGYNFDLDMITTEATGATFNEAGLTTAANPLTD